MRMTGDLRPVLDLAGLLRVNTTRKLAKFLPSHVRTRPTHVHQRIDEDCRADVSRRSTSAGMHFSWASDPGGRHRWTTAHAWLLLLAIFATCASCMTDRELDELKQETRDIFYHGFDNYMKYAFPEDELRPVTCAPLTRDRENPAHIELNDVLGNYSLTLIDSLSTLAIIASSPPKKQQKKALLYFQDGVEELVKQYGDGSEGRGGKGLRARGFDLDSKVQVFETVIRGVGGLLSAHQFAVGDLPVSGYEPIEQTKRGRTGIHWKSGFVYDGQLLRLARDLADRLMPAFVTPTGLPYPRVNLRHGVPFYRNSPLNVDPENGQCSTSSHQGVEITETCSAGAGSLVLEFSTLSRLSGDPKYEVAAKTAFWSVWKRQSSVGLIGSGIDAESGTWVHSSTGIGAGIDSFFEYAMKTHVLLSGLPFNQTRESSNSPDSFLQVWQAAHASIKRHVYRGPSFQHPHYLQVDLYTGALRAFWIDSLSAYYPGLLTLAGEVDEAIATHLLYTALWTRYSALPERWSTATGQIENGLRWWIGRPEFVESNWYIYRATQDPWYLHVAEMALRDIKRRCWTKCGWAGLQDVRSGEHMDRMESFFLGETAKYLFLTFDREHPLNLLDAPFVFTTEGHPLIIPKRLRKTRTSPQHAPADRHLGNLDTLKTPTCPASPSMQPLTVSRTAARKDIFHAASLARLHLMPTVDTLESPLTEFTADHPSISPSDLTSPSNYTYYPWTLPLDLVPPDGQCSEIASRVTFDLSFPTLAEAQNSYGSLQRVYDGILVNSMSGLRLGMVKEPLFHTPVRGPNVKPDMFRIYAISNVALGRDEKVFLGRDLISSFDIGDPYFTRIKDKGSVDLIVDIENELPEHAAQESPQTATKPSANSTIGAQVMTVGGDLRDVSSQASDGLLSSLLQRVHSMLQEDTRSQPAQSERPKLSRNIVPASLSTGPGTVMLPDLPEPLALPHDASKSPLPWTTIHVLDDPLCDEVIDATIVKNNQILVIQRGGCSFTQKLRNIPSYPPYSRSLQLVIVVSYPEHDNFDYEWAMKNKNADQKTASEAPIEGQGGGPSHEEHEHAAQNLIHPLLEQQQTTPGGMPRPHPIPLVMVAGGDDTMRAFKRARGLSFSRRWWFESQGTRIANLYVV